MDAVDAETLGQLNEKQIALSHKWGALVDALGLDADALNREAVDRL